MNLEINKNIVKFDKTYSLNRIEKILNAKNKTIFPIEKLKEADDSIYLKISDIDKSGYLQYYFNSLKSVALESYRFSSIEEHCFYNKYASFLTKDKIRVFSSLLYFFKNNFREELAFVKQDSLITLIKYLLSFSSKYKLEYIVKDLNFLKKPIKTNKKTKFIKNYSYDYIINYIRNEFQNIDLPCKRLNIKFDNINNIYNFINFFDKKQYSLMKVKTGTNEFTLDIFIFFYDEKFDIKRIVKSYFGEIIE